MSRFKALGAGLLDLVYRLLDYLKLGEFVSEAGGKRSHRRLVIVATSLTILFVWAVCSLSGPEPEMQPWPESVVVVFLTINGLSLGGRYVEKLEKKLGGDEDGTHHTSSKAS